MSGELYTLQSADGDGFIITKYDSIGFEVLSQYHMADAITCECPAGHRDTCRHRQMLPQMLDLIDSPTLYRFEDGKRFEFVEGKLTPVIEAKPFTVADLVRPEAATEGTEGSIVERPSFRRRI